MVKDTAKANKRGLMVAFTPVNGSKINVKVSGGKSGLTAISTSATGPMTNDQAKANTRGPMETRTTASGSTANAMVTVLSNVQMEV